MLIIVIGLLMTSGLMTHKCATWHPPLKHPNYCNTYDSTI